MRIQSPFHKFPNDNDEPKRNCAAEDHSLTIQNHSARKRERRPYPHTDTRSCKNVRSRKENADSTEKEPPCQDMSEPRDEEGDARVLCGYEDEFARIGRCSRCMKEDEPMPMINSSCQYRALHPCTSESPFALGERNQLGKFTRRCTSSPSSSWSRERHVWHARKPHGHPRWSLPNIRGTCMLQSSCELPHPAQE